MNWPWPGSRHHHAKQDIQTVKTAINNLSYNGAIVTKVPVPSSKTGWRRRCQGLFPREAPMKWTVPALFATAVCVSQITATDTRAAEIPKPTLDILKELKLDKSILKGLDEEMKLPAGWIEKAKKEKDLIIISSWDQKQFVKMTAPFKVRYPFINVRYARASYNARVVKTLIAYKEGRYLTDILTGFGGGVSLYKDNDALADLSDIPNFQKLKKDNRDPESRWLGQRLRYWCMAYNTKLVKKADLPKRWEDLITIKRWHNRKIGLANRPQLWLLMLWT
jgi:hypothetical protein